MNPRARFITLEGVDGAGKSTHVQWLAARLRAAGCAVLVTREPGGSPLGEKLRALLLHEPMHLATETLLMFAARAEHVHQTIAPALARGQWVICDRFTDATYAYQGGGRGLAMERIAALETWVHSDLQPDHTLLFDIPLEVARTRMTTSRDLDRFEREERAFFQRTRATYLARAAQHPARIHIIDACAGVADIRAHLQSLILSWLATHP